MLTAAFAKSLELNASRSVNFGGRALSAYPRMSAIAPLSLLAISLNHSDSLTLPPTFSNVFERPFSSSSFPPADSAAVVKFAMAPEMFPFFRSTMPCAVFRTMVPSGGRP
jgi:hypothetical protein